MWAGVEGAIYLHRWRYERPPLIPRTGVVHGMSNAAYHAHEALSKSQLAKFLICPAQYEGLVPQAPRIGP